MKIGLGCQGINIGEWQETQSQSLDQDEMWVLRFKRIEWTVGIEGKILRLGLN